MLEPSDIERAELPETSAAYIRDLEERIAELEHGITKFSDEIEQVYGGLASDRPPGPPTSLCLRMQSLAQAK